MCSCPARWASWCLHPPPRTQPTWPSTASPSTSPPSASSMCKKRSDASPSTTLDGGPCLPPPSGLSHAACSHLAQLHRSCTAAEGAQHLKVHSSARWRSETSQGMQRAPLRCACARAHTLWFCPLSRL